MSEQTQLDRTRRYLVPVARVNLPGQPDDVHLSVYTWNERIEEWLTGPALCGYSTSQGALPNGTEATCAECLEDKLDYERYLAPGYRPEDDDPKVLRARAEKAEADLARTRAFVEDMRTWCSPRGVAAHYADRILEVMDDSKQAGR
jgi:hypothetical protein